MALYVVCVLTRGPPDCRRLREMRCAGQGQGASSGTGAIDTTDTTGNLYHLVLCETRADSMSLCTGAVQQEGDLGSAEAAAIQ